MTQYINKAAVVAEIKERIKECNKLANAATDNNLSNTLQANELLIRQYTSLLSFLDMLEVKEVDINNETSQFIDANFEKVTIGHKLSLRRTAKHFFELGLMMKK